MQNKTSVFSVHIQNKILSTLEGQHPYIIKDVNQKPQKTLYLRKKEAF